MLTYGGTGQHRRQSWLQAERGKKVALKDKQNEIKKEKRHEQEITSVGIMKVTERLSCRPLFSLSWDVV